jgi:hypothetical protein
MLTSTSTYEEFEERGRRFPDLGEKVRGETVSQGLVGVVQRLLRCDGRDRRFLLWRRLPLVSVGALLALPKKLAPA